MPDNLKTTIHAYKFYINEPKDKAAYEALKAELKAQGLKCFESWGGKSHYLPGIDGREIELEIEHLFQEQWNTAPIDGFAEHGYRVHDWAQDYQVEQRGNKNLKQGHYLEQTAAMSEIRRNRYACGYCGKQEPAQKGYVFCPHCLDDEYLKEDQIHLTRMQSVAAKDDRPPLMQAESDHLLPLYRDAQLHGNTERGKARIAKQRADIEKYFTEAIAKATTKRDGLIWLMDRGIKIDNVIYYDHTNIFSFGWRSAVSEGFKSQLLDVLTEFPFSYEIKCEGGKKLEAAR